MPLIRLTPKRLAASRANARLSKGPSTDAGKEKVSSNACKHHLYARKFLLPPVWESRILAVVEPAAACIEDHVERAFCFQYLFFGQCWLELAGLEARLLNQSIRRHRSFHRGVHEFCVRDPLFLVISARLLQLQSQSQRARTVWLRVRDKIAERRTIPHLVENEIVTAAPKTLTLAAGASAGASRPFAGPETQSASTAPDRRSRCAPRRTSPEVYQSHISLKTRPFRQPRKHQCGRPPPPLARRRQTEKRRPPQREPPFS